MEKNLFKALYIVLGVALTINLLFNVRMHFGQWVESFGKEEAYLLPEIGQENTLSGRPEIHYGSASDAENRLSEEFYLSQAELKYLAKSQELVNGVEILGIRLMQGAPRWWDTYHPIIRRIDKLSKNMKETSLEEEQAKILKEFEELEDEFVSLNQKVDAHLKRFFAELEVARILTYSVPQSMSDKGRGYLRKLHKKLAQTEQMVRATLWKHHIIENPQDRKDGWSCKIIISSLLVRLQMRILSLPPSPANI